jgi:hypothetical protein
MDFGIYYFAVSSQRIVIKLLPGGLRLEEGSMREPKRSGGFAPGLLKRRGEDVRDYNK